MKKVFSLIMLAGSIILLESCGPIYNTEYKFIPPQSKSGKSCLENCPDLKEQCLEIEEINKRECDEINRRHMEDCQDDIYRKEKRAPKWNECGKIRGCAVSNERCEETYRNCYQSCGGEVRTERVCIANCENIQNK